MYKKIKPLQTCKGRIELDVGAFFIYVPVSLTLWYKFMTSKIKSQTYMPS